jgi:hypothetical protein
MYSTYARLLDLYTLKCYQAEMKLKKKYILNWNIFWNNTYKVRGKIEQIFKP